MTGKVTISEIDCLDGVHRIGIATLDNTASLNALTYDMLAELNDQLIEWQDDPDWFVSSSMGRAKKRFVQGAMYEPCTMSCTRKAKKRLPNSALTTSRSNTSVTT